jgi:hypothetical protein
VGVPKPPATGPLAAIFNRLSPQRAQQPSHPPIEEVAGSLRRLRRMLHSLPKGTSYVRSVGVANAYDQMLSVACEQLDVPNKLLTLRHGKQRDLERLRVEFELGECGLLL